MEMYSLTYDYDVIVVGAGHAGVEAALAPCAHGLAYRSPHAQCRYRRPDEL